MCADFNTELDQGKRLALALAIHLRQMSAGKAIIPVFIEDEKYEITVEHIAVTPNS